MITGFTRQTVEHRVPRTLEYGGCSAGNAGMTMSSANRMVLLDEEHRIAACMCGTFADYSHVDVAQIEPIVAVE